MEYLPINKYIVQIIKRYLPLPYLEELKNKTKNIVDHESIYLFNKSLYKRNGFYMYPMIQHYKDKWFFQSLMSMDFRERYLFDWKIRQMSN